MDDNTFVFLSEYSRVSPVDNNKTKIHKSVIVIYYTLNYRIILLTISMSICSPKVQHRISNWPRIMVEATLNTYSSSFCMLRLFVINLLNFIPTLMLLTNHPTIQLLLCTLAIGKRDVKINSLTGSRKCLRIFASFRNLRSRLQQQYSAKTMILCETNLY